MALNDFDFQRQSESALSRLNRALGIVAEQFDAEVLFQNGVLLIEVEHPNPGKIVISPNSSTHQIWISAQLKSFKLDWREGSFVLSATGETLDQLVGRLLGEQLGTEKIGL
jgi:iron donor protein CyaY